MKISLSSLAAALITIVVEPLRRQRH